ncbi:MAG: glycine--tRNA ligase subunit beta [Desulfovibrio sp.]|jgi:glycyl-tRNA synthetase beta chain|nr:glycine--tRNA ligase subunit beta [Desulfovibrio sp.]
MPAFVLEIGTEEIPARFLAATEKELAARFHAALEEAGLAFSGLTVCSTPRRLALCVREMAECSTLREELVTGPPSRAAFDVGGRPTLAAAGFAKTHGARLEDLFTVETAKGPYLALRKTEGGSLSVPLLAEICPRVIGALPFPKRMRWGEGEFSFARPVRWILALYGATPVPFTINGLSSGRESYGHRVHGPGPFPLDDAAWYFALMRDKCGIVSGAEERAEIIKERGDSLAAGKKGRVLWKSSLLEEVRYLCERPEPILGSFEQIYLEVPREVLLTSMEKHQKSFGVEGENGRLLPYFLTVLNMVPRDSDMVRKGWERVLRARLEDARFFWKTDLARAGFEHWLKSLDSVIFMTNLGNMGERARRLEKLCAYLSGQVRCNSGETPPPRADAMRAGFLAKADLVSEMVKEFDTLQGVMGGIYAARFGEKPEVAAAIAEQYLPAGPDSPVPPSLCGALVSLADKADALAGCFGMGLIPTGAADPYALRRAALGIARIALEKGLRFDVSAFFAEALRGYGEREWKLPPEQALLRLMDFFLLRLKNMFISEGAETLAVEAVIQAGADDVFAARERVSALAAFGASPDYAAGVLTFKRAANIIHKIDEDEALSIDGEYDSGLLAEEAEKALVAELERIAPLFDGFWAADRYPEIFALLGELRPVVDAFFDKVMVMCEDADLRRNRLNILKSLVNRLGRLADFSALQM